MSLDTPIKHQRDSHQQYFAHNNSCDNVTGVSEPTIRECEWEATQHFRLVFVLPIDLLWSVREQSSG